jgi:hypothetical protein
LSIEEDWLVRRVRELIASLKGQDMLQECAKCTTLFTPDADHCPHCGHKVGDDVDQAAAVTQRSADTQAGRPDQLDSPHGPGATLVGVNAAVEPDHSGDGEDGEVDENVNDYAEFNVEQLRKQAKDRGLFHPSNAKRDDLVALLQADDRKHQSEPPL